MFTQTRRLSNTHTLIGLLFCFLILYCSNTFAESKSLLPTIKVHPGYKVIKDPDSPGSETAEPYFEWSTTNCEYVLILGKDAEKYAPIGKIENGGSFIFVAVGPGGIAAQPAAARLSMKPGTGLQGVIYNFKEEFDADNFFQNSYKTSFSSRKSPEELAHLSQQILQDMGYTAATVKDTKAGNVTFTINFNFHGSLVQKPAEQTRDGMIQRQIGYVVSIQPELPPSTLQKYRILVLPMVKRNFPRDNTTWITDPDGLQLGNPAARELVMKISDAASQ